MAAVTPIASDATSARHVSASFLFIVGILLRELWIAWVEVSEDGSPGVLGLRKDLASACEAGHTCDEARRTPRQRKDHEDQDHPVDDGGSAG